MNFAEDAVAATIERFHSALAAKNSNAARQLLSHSDGFVFFGTDAGERTTSAADFIRRHEEVDWKAVDRYSFGVVSNLCIQHAETLACAMYEVSVDLTMAGEISRVPFRFALTMRKEEGCWRIIQGLAAIPNAH